jgi:hypothetical protein
VSTRPRSAASAASCAPSAAVRVSGLSTTTARPASSAARASGAWVRFGEAMTTASSSPGARVGLRGGGPAARVGGDDRGEAQAGRGADQRRMERRAGQAVADQADAQVGVAHDP